MDDVGGHARAIEVITDELAQYENGIHPSITELADAVHSELKVRYKDAVSVMRDYLFPVVQHILSRKPIQLQKLVPGSDLAWEHVLAPGLIWFERIETDYGSEYDYDALGYLEAPYIWLWMLARMIPPDAMRRLKILRRWEFNDYKELVRLLTGKGVHFRNKSRPHKPRHIEFDDPENENETRRSPQEGNSTVSNSSA